MELLLASWLVLPAAPIEEPQARVVQVDTDSGFSVPLNKEWRATFQWRYEDPRENPDRYREQTVVVALQRRF